MITRNNFDHGLETFGGAVFEQLSHFDWSQPLQASIEELGVAMGSHIGLKRSRNEDRVAVGRVQALNSVLYTVAIVCDGVGGSESGDRAATLAIAAILVELSSRRTRIALPELAAHLVRHSDELVRHQLGGRGTTTLCMFLASSAEKAVCVSIGDSRAYSWSPDTPVLQVSVDDTVENELKALPGNHQSLINARGLKGRLSQAIGESDRMADELHIEILPQERFASGVLLGSDGMWKLAKDFEAVMVNSRTANDAVRRGINLANWVGGIDNASLVAIDDLEKFSGTRGDSDRAHYQAILTLWLGSSKYSFFWDPKPHWTDTSKPEKVKRKQVKVVRKRQVADAPAQMELPVEKNLAGEPRPVIELTIRPKGKKD